MLHKLKSAADIFSTEPFHFEQFLSITIHGDETKVFKTDGFNLIFPPFALKHNSSHFYSL